jgi:MoaA/NifB/PqqE/SkfB family radical SAM enzyme
LKQGWGIVTELQSQSDDVAQPPGDPTAQTLVVEGGDLFVREKGRIWLRSADRWMELEGALADELAAVLDGGEPGSRLAALARSGLEGATALLEAVRRPRREVARDGLVVENPTILFLELTDSCPLHCRHCYADAGDGPGAEMDPDVARGLIDQASALGFDRLQLTGGEPLLHARVADLARSALAAGIRRVEVFTSGVGLSSERLAEFPGETSFAVSVYSADAAVHDAVTGVKGSLEATLGAIDRILARGSRMRVAVVSMTDDAADFERTRGELVGRGVPDSSIRASTVARVGRGEAIEPPDERVLSSDADPADPEPAPDPAVWPGKAAVAPNGDVFPCIFARWLRLGNVLERPLGEILARPALPEAAGLPVRERWTYCSERLSCPDCRVLAFGLMGRGR